MLKKSRPPSFGAITALVIAVTVATARAPRAQGPDAQVSAAAIQKVLDKQEQDWNKGDLDAFLEGYWASPTVVFQSGGERNVGFDAMRDRYRKRYKAEGRAMGRLAFS